VSKNFTEKMVEIQREVIDVVAVAVAVVVVVVVVA